MKKSLLIISCLFLLASIGKGQDLPIKDTSKTVKVSAKVLKTYTGHYLLEGMSLRIEIVLDQDQLYANVAGMGKIPLIPGTQTAFMASDIQAQVEFFDIQKKQAQKLRLYQQGSVSIGNRTDPPEQLVYDQVIVGNSEIDYTKVFSPHTTEWDLYINGRQVGAATTHLRHAIHNGESAYHGGSIIRYTSMGNKPFADVGIFSKKDHRLLWARNAISQTEEITTRVEGNNLVRTTIDINSGKVIEENTITHDQPVNGGSLQSLLSMGIQEDMKVEFPILGFDKVAWAKMHVVGKEKVTIEAMNKTYDAWKIEYSSGTIRWLVDEAPYMVKWIMPTGMEWRLKSVIK